LAGTKSVALLLDDPQNLYQQLLAREAQSAAAAHGLKLLPPEWAQGSPWTQLESINALLRKEPRPEGIVIMLAGRLTRGPAERLVKAGLAVVFIQRIPDWVLELQAAYRETLVAAVSPRQERLGEIQARHALRLLPAGSFVLLITGDLTTAAAAKRKQGFLDTVAQRLLVQVLDGRWSAAGTEQAISEWLRLGAERDRKIDLVVCANDAMAAGARRALVRYDKALAGVPMIGCDGLAQEGKPMLAKGELVATVVVPPTTPKALELLAAYWASGVRPGGIALLDSESLPPLEAR
jgi:ABC-type sugar transport system substrate-binding protein